MRKNSPKVLLDPLLETYSEMASTGLPLSLRGFEELKKIVKANIHFLDRCDKVRSKFDIFPPKMKTIDQAVVWVRRIRRTGKTDEFTEEVAELMDNFFIDQRWRLIVQHFVLTGELQEELAPTAFDLSFQGDGPHYLRLTLNRHTTRKDLIRAWPVIEKHLHALNPFMEERAGGYDSYICASKVRGGVKTMSKSKRLLPILSIDRYLSVLKLKAMKVKEVQIVEWCTDRLPDGTENKWFKGPQELRVAIHNFKKMIENIRVF